MACFDLELRVPDDLDPVDNSAAAEKVKAFPHTPGVYLMKDAAGRVIYVGKAKNLRTRAGSYFLKAAAEEQRTARLVLEIRDIDFLEAESEVDALLLEARLIKDIQPKFNQDLKDDKTFPYLEIHTREEFPRVEFTREPQRAGHEALWAVRQRQRTAGGDPGVAEDLQVPHLHARHRTRTTSAGSGSGPACWPRSINVRPPATCGSPRKSTARTSSACSEFLEGKKKPLLVQMREEMAAASRELRFEEAARLRDEIHLLETLDERGELDTHVQPEVFHIDPKKGAGRLAEGVEAGPAAADHRRRRHRPPRRQRDGGQPGAVHRRPALQAGLQAVQDPGVAGVDDFASIHEVVARRFQRLHDEGQIFPDMLLIDGGKGQLSAALAAFTALALDPPQVISLAKREEEILRDATPTNRCG